MPERSALDVAIDLNRDRRLAAQTDIAGLSLTELAREAQSELVAAAINYTTSYRDVPQDWSSHSEAPIVLSGHQPELFHPGVWFKNFLLDDVARQQNAIPVNVIVDNDLCKAPRIRVPGGTAAAPEITTVAYDAEHSVVPYEQREIVSREVFDAFPQRVTHVLQNLVDAPLVRELWPAMRAAAGRQHLLGNVLAEGRHRYEGELGLESLELPWSQVCDTRSFRRFLVHLLSNIAKFHPLYNDAVLDYRRRHRLRSQSHPVPLLRREDSWWETPLWIWSDAAPQRQALWVSIDGRQWKLRGDAGAPSLSQQDVITIEGDDADDRIDQLRTLRQGGVKIRSRALLTTMYARTVLSDLFIHGIGGAMYDQVTDVLISEFLACDRPTFVTATSTLHLPVPRPSVDHDDIRQADGILRDMWYHPERHLERLSSTAEQLPGMQELVDDKRAWIDGFVCPPCDESSGVSLGRQRHLALERINASLRESLQPVRQHLLQQRASLKRQLRVRNLLASREYSYCLFPRASILLIQ